MNHEATVPKAKHSVAGNEPSIGFSAVESAEYARDLLGALGAMAARHRQGRLVQLLEAAADEAERLANGSQIKSSE